MSMRGDSNVITTTPVFKKQDFQQQLNDLRVNEGYDFAGVALYEHHNSSAPIKWHYVSGNTNQRYKMIILCKGRGLAGMVMKTGKRMIIDDVASSLSPEDKIKYPILIAEDLTAMVAIPLCYNNQVYGVLLLGQRDGKALPDYETLDIHGKLWTFSEEM